MNGAFDETESFHNVAVFAIVFTLFVHLGMLRANDSYALDVPRTLDLHIPTPEDNRLSADRIELGQKLFFEKLLSRDRTLSCSSCHDPKTSFTVAEAFAKGIDRQRTTRNPPALVNRAYGRSFFWDGRAGSLEEQVLQPIQNEKELYLSLEVLETRLRKHEEYSEAFQQVFGQEPRRDDIARALSSFVRSLLVGDSPYDRYLLGEREALSPEARRGLKIFRGKANCTACHAGPNLTDEEFHNTGVAWRDGKLQDQGRYAVTKQDADRGAFKTPTLRQVSQTAPYMHDGSLTTLDDVVNRYNEGGIPNPQLDREIRPLNLSEQERKDLVAFLESLTGNIHFGAHGKPETVPQAKLADAETERPERSNQSSEDEQITSGEREKQRPPNARELGRAPQKPATAQGVTELPGTPDWLHDYKFKQQEFTFVRIKYGAQEGPQWRGRRFRGTWATDFPDADAGLCHQLQRLTSLKAKHIVLELTEKQLSDYPFIYICEPGKLKFTNDEVIALRKYLLGGGFLMVDDFWGAQEYDNFHDQMKRVFPEREPWELPLGHKIFHCVFDLQKKPQVPSIRAAFGGRDKGITWEPRPSSDTSKVHYRAITDDAGRIMVLMCHNTDLSDGWERTEESPWYFEEFSRKKAFPRGINIVFFAITQEHRR